MTRDVENLHTAARRFCIERSHYWRKQYYELNTDGRYNGGSYSDEALNLFPRYNCLDAILVEVEKFTPEDFSSLVEAKDILIHAGNTSESLFTASQSSIAKKAMQQEREDFIEYIKNISHEQLKTIEPLFYRRVLTESESKSLWAMLQEKWNIQPKSYWYPLIDSSIGGLIAFQEDAFDLNFGIQNIRQILLQNGIKRVWTLTESGPEYELDISEFEPLYYHAGTENYSFSQLADWVIYASHEGAITIGGKMLIDEIKTKWPDWECFVWESPSL